MEIRPVCSCSIPTFTVVALILRVASKQNIFSSWIAEYMVNIHNGFEIEERSWKAPDFIPKYLEGQAKMCLIFGGNFEK